MCVACSVLFTNVFRKYHLILSRQNSTFCQASCKTNQIVSAERQVRKHNDPTQMISPPLGCMRVTWRGRLQQVHCTCMMSQRTGDKKEVKQSASVESWSMLKRVSSVPNGRCWGPKGCSDGSDDVSSVNMLTSCGASARMLELRTYQQKCR